MPQYQPTIRLPFGYVQGIPRQASEQIRRDFEEVINNLPTGSTMFDAIIDARLTTSSAGTHHYKNLTDLIANEVWTGTFTVGVIQSRVSQIVEPGGIVIPDNMVFIGNAPSAEPGAAVLGWDNGAGTWSVSLGKTVIYQGLTFEPSNSPNMQSGGRALYRDCWFGSNVTTTNAALFGSFATHFACVFNTSPSIASGSGSGSNHTFYNCDVAGNFSVGNLITVDFYGGSIGGTLTVTNGGQGNFYGSFNAVSLSSLGGAVTVNNVGATNNGLLSVSETSFPTDVTGNFGGINYSGTSTAGRHFKGSSNTPGNVVFTGPGHFELDANMNSSTDVVELHGDGIFAQIAAMSGILNCFSLTNSVIVCEFTTLGHSYYTFDAGTHNNVFIFGGTHNANFQTGSVILSTGLLNRVITEDTDSLLSGSGAPTSPNLLMGELAAIQSGVQTFPNPYTTVDVQRHDLLEGEIAAVQSGVQTIPAPVAATSDVNLHDFRQVFMLMGG